MKRRPPSEQSSFFVAPKVAPVIAAPHIETIPEPTPEPEPAAAKLRLAYSRPNEGVEIEPCPQGGYWVQRRRKNGTIFASVHYTRGELELLSRILASTLVAV